jgi:hypothetical protein
VVLDVLDPEWDVLIEIQQSLKSLPGVHLEYVEGHQDKQTQYHNLDLLAQLNVDADRIAGRYHEFGYPHSPFVIMSPNTRAHLVFDEGTITSRYEESIRLRATGPSLKEYIRKKHKWKASIMESIDWRSHGQALKRNKQRQTHLVKFIHNILPTTGLQNKFDGGTRSCPLCPCRQEDRDHIFRCPHPTRATWRTNFLDNIQTYCEVTNTYPPLKCLLIFVLRSWLDGTDNPSPDPRQYPSDLYILLRRQQHIGWSQLLQGRFAAEWGVLQTKYHERTYPTQQYTPERWQVGLITKIWDLWQMLWSSRNQELFGKDELSRQKAQSTEIHRQLSAIYATRGMMEPSAQTLLLDTPEAHSQYPMHVTKNWLLMHTATFSESVKRVKSKALQGVRSIRSYFSTIAHNTPAP